MSYSPGGAIPIQSDPYYAYYSVVEVTNYNYSRYCN